MTHFEDFFVLFDLPNALCGSRKYPYPPQGRSLEILRGRGVSKAKLFKGKYEAKLEIPGGKGGFKPKNLPWGRYRYILEPHIFTNIIITMINLTWKRMVMLHHHHHHHPPAIAQGDHVFTFRDPNMPLQSCC